MCSPAPRCQQGGTDLNLLICVFAKAIDHRGLIHFTRQISERRQLPPPALSDPPTRHTHSHCLCAAVCIFMYEFCVASVRIAMSSAERLGPIKQTSCPCSSVRELNTLWACSLACEISLAQIFTTSGHFPGSALLIVRPDVNEWARGGKAQRSCCSKCCSSPGLASPGHVRPATTITHPSCRPSVSQGAVSWQAQS